MEQCADIFTEVSTEKGKWKHACNLIRVIDPSTRPPHAFPMTTSMQLTHQTLPSVRQTTYSQAVGASRAQFDGNVPCCPSSDGRQHSSFVEGEFCVLPHNQHDEHAEQPTISDCCSAGCCSEQDSRDNMDNVLGSGYSVSDGGAPGHRVCG